MNKLIFFERNENSPYFFNIPSILLVVPIMGERSYFRGSARTLLLDGWARIWQFSGPARVWQQYQ